MAIGLRERIHPRWVALAAIVLAAGGLGAAAVSTLLADPLPEAGPAEPLSEQELLDAFGALDSDRDGLADAVENYRSGTDPLVWNTTGSQVPDGWLVRFGYDPLEPGVAQKPAAIPPREQWPAFATANYPLEDQATLTGVYLHGRPAGWDEAEDGPWDSGLDPREWDNDGDGVPDGYLLAHGLDPLASLAQQRLAGPGGLTVAQAYRHGTDPTSLDSDEDGLEDVEELAGPANPVDPGSPFEPTDPRLYSTTNSGVCDGYLVAHGLDPLDAAVASSDPDRDGATVLEEHVWNVENAPGSCATGQGLDPLDAESADAGLPDGWLIRYGLDPFEQGVADRETQKASDGPGPAAPAGTPDLALTVADEYASHRPEQWDEAAHGPWWGGSDPTLADTDLDGLGDAWEARGYTVRAVTELGGGAAQATAVHPDPAQADGDLDGLSDLAEAGGANGHVTDATRRDTDLDGLDDGAEAALPGLDPVLADSAGDLLTDGERLDLLTTLAAAYSSNPVYPGGEPGTARHVFDWLHAPGSAPGGTISSEQARTLLGPSGDLDGDNKDGSGLNLVDPDIDGDGLLNGLEHDPALYARSPLGTGGLPGGRPATDLVNADTDGDGLLDGWEAENSVQDLHPLLVRLVPSPARWNSDDEVEPAGQKQHDGLEDPDDDSIDWFSFERTATGYQAVQHRYAFDNLHEQDAETDPNVRMTDDDGLLDGWKAFWSLEYPTMTGDDLGDLYPGSDSPSPGVAGPPDIGTRRRPELRTELGDFDLAAGRHLETVRFAVYAKTEDIPGLLRPHEDDTALFASRRIVQIEGDWPFTFEDAQDAGTNPYMDDTDGDGLSDLWEWVHFRIPANGSCRDIPGPNPTVHDGKEDPDQDGLTNAQEEALGTHPLCRDTDQGGVPDGEEDTLGLTLLDPRDDILGDDKDQDEDGVSDLRERRDLHTSPLDPDSDGDGLLDGGNVPATGGVPDTDTLARKLLDRGIAYSTTCAVATRPCPAASLRYTFLGEAALSTDPTEADPADKGVPQGWLVVHGFDPLGSTATSSVRAAYRIGIPAWWETARHGVWWGGALPSEVSNPNGVDRSDLDRDGLLDSAGEDPFPGANHYNEPREIDWTLHSLDNSTAEEDARDGTLPRTAQKLLAQTLVNPIHRDAQRASRHPDPNALLSDGHHHARAPATLTGLSMPSSVARGGSIHLTGRLVSGAEGVGGATIVAELDGQTVGADFTDPDGGFDVLVALVPSQSRTMPDAAFSLLGERRGEVSWTADMPEVHLGDRTLVVRSYATPNTDPHAATWEPVLRDDAALPLRVSATPVLSIEAPAQVETDEDATVTVRSVDAAGVPLQDKVRLEVGSFYSEERTPDEEGVAQFTVRVPHASAGSLQAKAANLPADGGPIGKTTAFASVLALRPAAITADAPERVLAGDPFEVTGRLTAPGGGTGGLKVTATLGSSVGTATTGGDGSFRIALNAPSDLGGGGQPILVEADRGPKTSLASISTQIYLVGRPMLLLDALPMELGEPAKVSGRLLGPDQLPEGDEGLSDVTLTYSFGGVEGTAKTGKDGRFSKDVVPQQWGLLTERVSFGGDSEHTEVTATVQRPVLSDTSMRFPSGTVPRGEAAELSVTLLDRLGQPVPGMGISIQWGSEPPQGTVTNAQGVARLPHPTDPDAVPGAVLVKASFPGSPDGALRASAAQATWTVRAQAAFVLGDTVLVAGQPAPAARLVDAASGAGLSGRTVTASVDGVQSTYTTGPGGSFAPLVAPDAGAKPDAFGITMSFAGDKLYPKLTARVPLLLKSPTFLHASPVELPRGQSTPVPVTLEDLAGRPVDGEALAELGGAPAGNGTLEGGEGHVVVAVPADAVVGAARLTISYAGDRGHLPSATDLDVRIVRPTELQVRVREGEDNTTLVVAALALSEGEPLPGALLHLLVEGMPGGVTATTDGDGRVEFPIPADHADQAFAVRLESSDSWTAATASAQLTPAPEPSAYASQWQAWAIAGGLLALAAVAGLVYLLRGRSEISLTFAEARERVLARGPVEAGILGAYDVLETAALRLGWIAGRATTPRRLEQALADRLPASVHADLDQLVALFEEARYGQTAMADSDRQAARRALGRIRAGAAWRGER